jgi:D-sedoheptulose 7-phosphate isomerase
MDAHRDSILNHLRESCRVKQSFSADLLARIETFAVRSAEALGNGRKLVFFGNGGSAADAQHLAAELTVKLQTQRPSLAALALTTNASVLTAVGNDFGFDQIFSRQIESLVSAGDVLVALSTSGASPNIVRALDVPSARAAYRVALTGETGGELASRVDLLINVPSRNPQHIQEAHITIGHVACALIEQMRAGRAAR